MSKEIHIAIENLPEELVTPEIASAAIEEGNIKLLDCLPHRYLTGEVIIRIIEKNVDSYSWNRFSLSNIPKNLRTETVCEFAVKKSAANIVDVPREMRSATMLDRLLDSTEENLKYMHLFNQNVWDNDLATKGLHSMYRHYQNNYGPRGGWHGSSVKCDIKRLQIFLTYVPDTIKTPQFYIGLLNHGVNAVDVDALLKERDKDKDFYLLIAANDFSIVPPAFYDYDILTTAISNRKLRLHGYNHTEDADGRIKECLHKVLDDRLADLIVTNEPEALVELHDSFKTPERLVRALEATTDRQFRLGDKHYSLLTEEVCKTYIRKNMDLPKLPEKIWTVEFVDYCMNHGTSFRWFEQMPKDLQTPKIVDAALTYSGHLISYARQELISLEQAMKIYRDNDYYRKYVPQYYINEFKNETGLDERFFGGEVPFNNLRELRAENTYCKLGNTYVGIYREGGYCGALMLTVTRRTPRLIRPVPVFEREIGTFHTTWIEKMFADYDISFIKPAVSKALKPYQYNSYYNIEKVKVKSGTTIYANVLYDEKVGFSAKVGDDISICNSLEDIEKKIDEYESTKKEAA